MALNVHSGLYTTTTFSSVRVFPDVKYEKNPIDMPVSLGRINKKLLLHLTVFGCQEGGGLSEAIKKEKFVTKIR